MKTHLLELKCVSSLTKVFPDSELGEEEYRNGSALRGEVFSFQAAYRSPYLSKRLRLETDIGKTGLRVKIYRAGLVPSEMPVYDDPDDYMLRTEPGLYPDPLYPFGKEEKLCAYPQQWRSLWFSLSVPEEAEPGEYPVTIRISGRDDTTFGKNREWFSADCIGTWYGEKTFSDRWWSLVENYVKNAAHHEVNMLLTPVFTPPIETRQGDGASGGAACGNMAESTGLILQNWGNGHPWRNGVGLNISKCPICSLSGARYTRPQSGCMRRKR